MAVESIPNFFNEVTVQGMKDHPDKFKAVNAVYKFNITGDAGGTWILNCKEPSCTAGDGEAQCTVTAASEDFLKLINGQAQGPQLFMMGRLKVQGDMGLALKLQKVFDALK